MRGTSTASIAAVLAAASLPAGCDAMAQWINSTEGIHAFLTFDSSAVPANITAFANDIDYVWGAQQIATWRNSTNPDVVLSKYIPYCRDPTPHLDKNNSGLPWWQENKPELVLYQCDQVTPAWECFPGEGCAHVSVPLDLSNPETLEYQMEVAVLPAAQDGYNAIALDNYGLTNTWKACGSFKGPNGTWVQMYGNGGVAPEDDPQYTADVLNWTARAVDQIHGAGLLVIPNFSDLNLEDECVLTMSNLTDGILSEAGFALWDPVPNTTSFTTPPPMTNPDKFKAQVEFIRNMQNYGKGFYAINEWGAGPDYGLNPAMIPYNITGDANRPIRQFVSAAFMMVNGGTCGIHLTCIQCYGGNAGGDGGLSIWPEYSAPVGHPEGEPYMDDRGVWQRSYSSGIAIVNPTTSDLAQTLPVLPTGLLWQDLYGDGVGSSVTVPAGGGLVLLKVKL